MDEGMRNALLMSGGNNPRPDRKGRRKGFSNSPLDAWFFHSKVLPIIGKPLQKLGGALIDKFVPERVKQLGGAILGGIKSIWGDEPAADAQQQPIAIEGGQEQAPAGGQERRVLEDVQANPNANPGEENVVRGRVEEPDDNDAFANDREVDNVSVNPQRQAENAGQGANAAPPRPDTAPPAQTGNWKAVLSKGLKYAGSAVVNVGVPALTGLFVGGPGGAAAGAVSGALNMVGGRNKENNPTNIRGKTTDLIKRGTGSIVDNFAANTGQDVGNAAKTGLVELGPKAALVVGNAAEKGLGATTKKMQEGNMVSRISGRQLDKNTKYIAEGAQASVQQVLTDAAQDVGDTASKVTSQIVSNVGNRIMDGVANAATFPLKGLDNIIGGANTVYQAGKNMIGGAYDYITGKSSQAGGLSDAPTFSRDPNTISLTPGGYGNQNYRAQGGGSFANQANFVDTRPKGLLSSWFGRK